MSMPDLTRCLADLEREPSYDSYVAVANALDNMNTEESGLPVSRIAVLRNFTFEPLLAVIKSEIARMGFFPSIYVGGYDSVAVDTMNPDSGFYRFKPDFVIIAQWLEELSPQLMTRFLSLDADKIAAETQRVLDTVTDIIGSVRRHCKAPILINNFPIPDYAAFGALDAQAEGMQINTLRRLNMELLRRAKEISDVYMVDYAYLMSRLGYQNGFDERYWHMGKAPISRHAVLPFGLEYSRFIRALCGKAHKCLILDCDNTLWGGIVGEEGIEKIRLGPAYPGSCYRAFQREILNLHDKGVILALCSKNNEEDVLEVLRRHPYMLLREEVFSTWQINWDDKATNIRRIVKELNIGMDSVVFADESEYEIGLVKSQIPEITVLKLPAEPSRFRAELSKMGYFDSLSFSKEDRYRNKMYRDEAKRKQILTKACSMIDYLKQLQISVHIGRPDPFHIPRAAQLTQKTNQFNLTAKRYTESDIATFAGDPRWDVLCLRLKDKISDMGLVGVAILKYDGAIAEIDTLLMSCRALGRGAEDALYAYIINQVQSKGFKTLRGRYIPTPKNRQVSDFYSRRGFACVAKKGEEAQWELALKGLVYEAPKWINIESERG